MPIYIIFKRECANFDYTDEFVGAFTNRELAEKETTLLSETEGVEDSESVWGRVEFWIKEVNLDERIMTKHLA